MEKKKLITGLNKTWDLLDNLEAYPGVGKNAVKEIQECKDFIQKLSMEAEGMETK